MKTTRCSGPFLTRLFLTGLPLGLIAGGIVAVLLFAVRHDRSARPVTSAVSPAAVTAPL